MTRTGFIDHIGIGVPDLVAAKQYYDDLMFVLGSSRVVRDRVPEGHSTMGLTVLEAHSSSSTRQKQAPTHACRQAFITSHSWLRAARSSAKHTSGRVRATPSSWTSPASIPSTGRIVLRPTGSILMDSSSKRFATVRKRASWRYSPLDAPLN